MKSATPVPVTLRDTLMYYLVGFAVQTLFFGGYSVIMFLSTRMLMKRGLNTRAHKNLFMIIIFMYTLSAVYWAYEGFANLATRLQAFIDNPNAQEIAGVPGTKYMVLFNAIIPINYILADGVVVWRARLICAPEHRKYMLLPMSFIVLTSLAVLALISLRVIAYWPITFTSTTGYTDTIDLIQVSGLCVSLLSNFTTTGVVAATAWQHREAIRDGFQKTSNGNRVLSLLRDSGVLYCVLAILGLVFSFVRLPYNTLGDIYGLVNVEIASAYTPTLILLVNIKESLNETSFLGTLDIPDTAHSTEVNVQLTPSPVAVNWSMLEAGSKSADVQTIPGVESVDSGAHSTPSGISGPSKSHKFQYSDATLV